LRLQLFPRDCWATSCLPACLPRRGLFIIDGQGILRQITINDLPVGRSVDETLRLVKAFQHTDSHGEVCPANWQPGKDTVGSS